MASSKGKHLNSPSKMGNSARIANLQSLSEAKEKPFPADEWPVYRVD